MEVSIDSMNGKIYVYITSAYYLKVKLQENGKKLRIESKSISRIVPLPCAVKKVEKINSISPDMHVITLIPKDPKDLPKDPTEYDIELDMLLEELTIEDDEKVDSELEKILKLEELNDDFEDEYDDEDVEEEGYDFYEKPFEDDEDEEEMGILENDTCVDYFSTQL